MWLPRSLAVGVVHGSLMDPFVQCGVVSWASIVGPRASLGLTSRLTL